MKVITIGRNSNNDITINDPKVSRHHCQIVQFDNGTYGIVDFGSKNGTFVNGQRVYGQVSLKRGDRLHVAQNEVPWQQNFSSVGKKHKNWWLWPTVGGAAAVMVAIIVLLALRFVGWHGGNIYYSGDYPTVAQVTFEQDGCSYSIEAVQGQVMVFFADDVSHRDALSSIKKAGGIVVAQIPKAHYYLISTNIGEESVFMKKLRLYAATDFVYPNAVSYPCVATPHVIDNFNTDLEEYSASHGKIVSAAINECEDGVSISTFDAGIKRTRSLNRNEILQNLEKVLSDDTRTDALVINMSFGTGFSEDVDYWREASDSARKEYVMDYISEIIEFINLIETYDDKDFVIVKAAGNEGVKAFGKEILVPLYKRLDEKQLALMKRHILLVSAEDTRELWVCPTDKKCTMKEAVNYYKEYSNEIEVGKYHPLVTKVDISDFKYHDIDVPGTSIASPRAACFISSAANNHDMKVTDVLKYAREATKKAPDHILTQEMLEKVIEDHLGSASEATIEGVLKMYLLDNSGDGSTTYFIDTNGRVEYAVGTDDSHGCVINQYRSTKEGEYIAFVVESDKIIDVRKYLDENEMDFLDKNQYSAFMVVPNTQYSNDEFAAKYANKRVRVTGKLYVPGGGWRNATEVAMGLRTIRLLDKKAIEPKGAHAKSNSLSDKETLKYTYKIPCNKRLFESKKTGRIDLPNGDEIKYQYRYGDDSELRYSYGKSCYIRFSLANQESIRKKYCICAKQSLDDDAIWGGINNPWDEVLSIKPIDLPIYSERNQPINPKDENIYIIIMPG